jgi:hypothetical protein
LPKSYAFPLDFRLLCALEGKYLVDDMCYDLIDGADAAIGHHELQNLSFSCHIPNMTGRGFIEVSYIIIYFLFPWHSFSKMKSA